MSVRTLLLGLLASFALACQTTKGPAASIAEVKNVGSARAAPTELQHRRCRLDVDFASKDEPTTNEYDVVIDPRGRIVELRSTPVTPANGWRTVIERSHDDAGRMLTERRRRLGEGTEIETRLAWSRDPQGRVEAVTHVEEHLKGFATGQRSTHTVTVVKRDAMGHPTRLDAVSTSRAGDWRRENQAGQSGEVVERESPLREREYDREGRLSVERWVSRFANEPEQVTRRLTYDPQGRVHVDEHTIDNTRWPKGERKVTTYDQRGHIVRVETFKQSLYDGFSDTPELVVSFTYDDAGRRATASANGKLGATYLYAGDCPPDLIELLEEPDMLSIE